MKSNEAPEKLYVELCSDGVYAHTREWENSDNIKYTRTDAFVDKACKWLEKNVAEATGIDSYTITESFKQAMEE